MKTTHSKISDHFKGIGTVSPSMVDQRAKELATIDGRNPEEFTEGDWVLAKEEMLGQSGGATDEESPVATEQAEEAPGTSGRQIPNQLPSDEPLIPQLLVEQGVEEAQHDQMLEASRSDTEQENP